MVIPFGTGGGIWRKNKVPERLPFNIFLQEIRSGNLKSGDKILNERQLADLLGISRVPLREAILHIVNTWNFRGASRKWDICQ